MTILISEGDLINVGEERMYVAATSRDRVTGVISIQLERGPHDAAQPHGR